MYTGNTNHKPAFLLTRTVYPCVYREHAMLRVPSVRNCRFIPVYTGNTDFQYYSPLEFAVYPCVYREHFCSSPLDVKIARFIPVYTGNTIQVAPCFYCNRGLSLCIQGTLYKKYVERGENRFIPVYTGNTLTVLFTASRIPVYPCVYREHNQIGFGSGKNRGLSLCIQGTL